MGPLVPIVSYDFLMAANAAISKLIVLSVNPWFITGFTDGDGSLGLTIRKAKDNRFKYSVL